MGVGTFYTTGDSEKGVRRYWRGWPARLLELCRSEQNGQVTFLVEATCEVSVVCDRCGQSRCLGCGMRVSIDISGGKEEVTCIPRCDPKEVVESSRSVIV